MVPLRDVVVRPARRGRSQHRQARGRAVQGLDLRFPRPRTGPARCPAGSCTGRRDVVDLESMNIGSVDSFHVWTMCGLRPVSARQTRETVDWDMLADLAIDLVDQCVPAWRTRFQGGRDHLLDLLVGHRPGLPPGNCRSAPPARPPGTATATSPPSPETSAVAGHRADRVPPRRPARSWTSAPAPAPSPAAAPTLKDPPLPSMASTSGSSFGLGISQAY